MVAPNRRSLAFLLLGLTACGGTSVDEILQLRDLTPRQIEVGDRISITGAEYPAANDIRRISVTLRGQLARAGRPLCEAVTEVTIADPPVGAVTTDVLTGRVRDQTYAESNHRAVQLDGANRLEFTVTESMLAQMSRCPTEPVSDAIDVPHATLSFGLAGVQAQGITVTIEGLTGEHAIAGTLRGVTLDLNAPPARRVALEAGAQEAASHLLDFLGIALASSNPDDGGLRVGQRARRKPGRASGNRLERRRLCASTV